VVAGSMEDPVTLSSRTIRGMTAAQNNLWADTGGVNVNKLDGISIELDLNVSASFKTHLQ